MNYVFMDYAMSRLKSELLKSVLERYVEMRFPSSPAMLDSVLQGKAMTAYHLSEEAIRFKTNQRAFLDGELLIVDNRGARQRYGTCKINIDTLKPT